MSRPEHEFEKTIPWSAEEFACVGGFAVVYTREPRTQDLIFHLPGGAQATQGMLTLRGLAVRLPKRARLEG